MKRLVLVAVLLAAALAAPGVARAGACGLPDAKPLWIDYGAPELKQVFGRPGVIVAGSGELYPAEMRAQGAQTVFWDMYLNKRVGTPSAPASPALLAERAQKLFDFAVKSSGCPTPWIVMNELFGASATTPWTPTQAAYRANVLQWARLLAERGARPVLLVSSEPYTGGWDAAQWWRDLAQVADVVLEKYFSAPALWRAGTVLGNRRLRASLRRSAGRLFAIGVPPAKLGFMLGFQTKRGAGGREGLDRDAWFQVAKWQALAAKQVAGELGIAHVWSWGWGHFADTAAFDEDKKGAACVWLWVRDRVLCDAPAELGPSFDADLRAGQLDLPAGVRCVLGDEAITMNEINDLARVTGDRELALSALLARLVESRAAAVASADVLAAERAIVAARYAGSRAAYLADLARRRATLAVARGAIADALRRDELRSRFRVARPTGAQVAAFYRTYAQVPLRELAASVPDVDPSTPLGALPLGAVRPAIVRALRASAQEDAFRAWTAKRQWAALDELVCERDRLPAVGAPELTSWLPTLAPVAAAR